MALAKPTMAINAHPNEVTIWAGGPLTNIALALRLDPQVATLAKELVLMGAGFNVGQGGIHRVNGRREFNWWFDPESVRIAMSAPWRKITITPVDISVKTRLSDEIKAEIGKCSLETTTSLRYNLIRGGGRTSTKRPQQYLRADGADPCRRSG